MLQLCTRLFAQRQQSATLRETLAYSEQFVPSSDWLRRRCSVSCLPSTYQQRRRAEHNHHDPEREKANGRPHDVPRSSRKRRGNNTLDWMQAIDFRVGLLSSAGSPRSTQIYINELPQLIASK